MSGYQNEAARQELAKRKSVYVKVIEARGVKAADFGGTSDPFCEIRIRGDTQALKTKTIKKTLNPYWNEEFTLYPKDIDTDYVEIKCYDFDQGTSNDLLGVLEIPVAALQNKPPTDSWRPLGKKVGPGNIKTDGKYGEIHLVVELREPGQSVSAAPVVAGPGVQVGAAPPAAGMPPVAAQPGYPPQQQPGYPPQQHPGYPPQQQPGYPPQQGYPPQGQPGYPPVGQPGYPPQQGYPPQGQPGYPPMGQPGYPPHGGAYPPPGMGAPAAYPPGQVPPGYKMSKKGILKPIKDKKDKKKKKK